MSGTLVYVNPAAGGGRAGTLWPRLSAVCPELTAFPVLFDPDRARSLATLREFVADASLERVIVVGGDGTFHDVAEAVLAAGAGDRIHLGLVPAGTGADLARNLGLPMRAARAVAPALSAATRRIDALAIRTSEGRTTWAVNSSSAGISGLVVERVNALASKSPSSYVTTTLGVCFGYRPSLFRVEVDGRLWLEKELLIASFTNGRFFGRGMKVAPAAAVDDGHFDVVAIESVPLWQRPARLAQVVFGAHLKARPVHHVQARQARVTALTPAPPFELDGDSLPATEIEIEIVPGALRVAQGQS